MNRKLLSRRTLLRGVGTALALPWMEAMASPTLAFGAGAFGCNEFKPEKPPVRMAFLYVPNGMHMPNWRPSDEGGEFVLPKVFEPVKKFRDQTTIISGLSLSGADAHGDGGGDHARSVAAFLTGAHPKKTDGSNIQNGVSVDQVAAKQIGDLTKIPSLELGTEASSPGGRCDTGYSCVYTSNISWRTETSPLPKETNPQSVFDRMFSSGHSADDKKANELRNKNRKSILDFVKSDARALHNKLGASDRRKLNEYMYAVREVEKQLAGTEILDKPEEDVPDFPRPAGVPRKYGEHIKLLFDMMVLAFQTDTTRTISFMYANAGSNRSYRNIGVSGGHHTLSHHNRDQAKQDQIAKINLYHMSLAEHLLERLSQIREGNKSLLDNCMIMYGSGIADGNSHAHRDLPIALFGNGGGLIRSARHLKVPRRTPLTNLYVSMLNGVGAKVDQFSDSTGRIDLS